MVFIKNLFRFVFGSDPRTTIGAYILAIGYFLSQNPDLLGVGVPQDKPLAARFIDFLASGGAAYFGRSAKDVGQ